MPLCFIAAVLLIAPLMRAATPTLDEVWQHPPPEARLRAYWWWLNGNVDAAAITRDLREMKAKGFGGAVIVDAGGAEQRDNQPVPHGPTFASPEWVALLRTALAEADRLGLEISLNIQSGWNLGGPMVSDDDAVKALVFSRTTLSGPADRDVVLPAPERVDGYYRDLFVLAFPLRHPASSGITQWQAKTLEQKLPFTGPDAFFLTNSAPKTDLLVTETPDRDGEEDTSPSEIINLTSAVSSDGRLRWTPPAGTWQILRFGCTLATVHRVSTQSDGWAGNAIDVFDGGAFDRYAKAVVVPLLDAVRPYTGRSLRYLHTDSWEVDLTNWTPTLRTEFQQRRGYDPLPYMPAFAGCIIGSRSTTQRFLNDYRKTLGELAIDNHYRRFRELAHRYGLGIHPESGGPHYTPIDAQRCLGTNDIPMSEFWARSPTHRTTDASRFFVKQPASAAHTYGLPFVAAEAFTTIGPHWQETLWDNLKPSFDYALGEGLNRVVWHAFVCSPLSMGIPGQQYFAGTHLNPNVTWWDQAGPFFDYLNRCQAMMQRGRFVADAVYYYGDHVPNFTQLRASDPAGVGPGYDYDVITEDALVERAHVLDGRIVLPDGMSYRLLVLAPEGTISLPVLRKVRELVAAGATVLGLPPEAAASLSGQPAADLEVHEWVRELWRGPGSGGVAEAAREAPSEDSAAPPSARAGRVISDRNAREVLADRGIPPDIAFAGAPNERLVSMHRREGDTDIYFVANRLNAAIQVEASFRVSGRAPELWNPVTAERRFAAAYTAGPDVTNLPLELPPYGSLFVVFRAPAVEHPASARTNAPSFVVTSQIDGPWTVSFDPAWGGPKTAEFARLTSWTTRPEPGIRYYSGRATYRKKFVPPELATASRLWLDLGMVRELATVRVNGESVGTVWAPPFRVDISSVVHPGENQLEVEVVNFWPNRIIGDASLPEKDRLTRTNITRLNKTTPLMPSGLLGPVQLLTSR